MINVNLCKIDSTGKFIELNFNSTVLFSKVLLYTHSNYETCNSRYANKGIDLSHLLEKTDTKESFLINLLDLGFSNSLSLFFIYIENEQGESTTVTTANLTDIVLDNLDRLSNLKLDNNSCSYVDNCKGKVLDDILYTQAGIEGLPFLLQLKRFTEARNLYYSLNNMLTVPCEVFYEEFTIYTLDNNVKFNTTQTLME